jgi:hypothetical protein
MAFWVVLRVAPQAGRDARRLAFGNPALSGVIGEQTWVWPFALDGHVEPLQPNGDLDATQISTFGS